MAKSRWGGYTRGRNFISTGATVRSGTQTVPTSLDFRDAVGIWNMKSSLQFPKFQKLQMALQSSSFQGSAATVTTYSCPVPTAARVGDVAIAFFVLNGTTATMSTPTGWTLATSSATYPRIYSFFKTLVSGDLNTTISGSGAVAAGYSSGMMTFNGSGNTPAAADAFTYSTTGGVTNSGAGAASVTVTSSAGNVGGLSAASYRYIRWNVTATKTAGNLMQASEFVLQNNGTDISMTGTTVTSSIAGNAGELASNLVDANTATKYCALSSSSTAGPWTFTFDLGSIKTFNGYRWATANDVEGRDPAAWTIEVSNDNSTWTTIDTITGYVATATRLTYVDSRTVLSSSIVSGSVIAVGCACGNPTTQVNTVTLTNQTGSIACDATTGMSAGNIVMAYSIFNYGTTPLNLTVATNDAGSQAAGGYYLNCTIGT